MHENSNASLDYTRSNTIQYFSNLYLEYIFRKSPLNRIYEPKGSE